MTMPTPGHPSPEPSASGPSEAEAYVQQALRLLELSVPPEQLASVVENFERVQAIAHPVLTFPLPDHLEAAPQFEP